MNQVTRLGEAATALSPLQAYELADRQRRHLGASFRARIIRLYRRISADSHAIQRGFKAVPEPHRIPWTIGHRELHRLREADEAAICEAYRSLVMRYGVKRIDPQSASFFGDLDEFYRNYLNNFPLPTEQETLEGFRRLLQSPARKDGYEERCYSVICPLTGCYLMGVNFAVQPESNSIYFIYGFVNPIARGIGKFSRSLLEIMRSVSQSSILAYLQRHSARRPLYCEKQNPILLFEKNAVEEMSLTDILTDSAAVDIDHPPRLGACLTSSAIGQHIRDLVWHRCGARVVDYNYLQPSLDGVVTIDESLRDAVIAYLNRKPLGKNVRRHAEVELRSRQEGMIAGCATLQLCVFDETGNSSLPTAQIRQAVETYQGISIVKDPSSLADDIYFQAQLTSLAERSLDGRVPLKPISADGSWPSGFLRAESEMKQLLGTLTWEELRMARDRPYHEWLDRKRKLLRPPAPDARLHIEGDLVA